MPDDDYTVPIGKARIFKEGEDVTIIGWGAMLHEALAAAERLKAEGVSAEVIDVRAFVPFDHDTIIESVEKTGRVVIVHEAVRTAGFGAEIIAQINEKALTALEAPVVRVTGFDTAMPAFRAEHLYLPNADRIRQAVHKVLQG